MRADPAPTVTVGMNHGGGGGGHRGNFGMAREGFGAGRQDRGRGRATGQNLTWERTNKDSVARDDAAKEEEQQQSAEERWEGKKGQGKQSDDQWCVCVALPIINLGLLVKSVVCLTMSPKIVEDSVVRYVGFKVIWHMIVRNAFPGTVGLNSVQPK